jgi:hypothetical protein
MIKTIVRFTYKKFGYFLMFLLGLGIILNGFTEISGWIAWPLTITMILSVLAIAIVVEFNEGPETLWTKFLSRFMKLDVLGACVAIIFYIGTCNNLLDMVY